MIGYLCLGLAILVNLPFLIHCARHLPRPVLDWPVWVYRLRKRSHPWLQKRATDLGGYLIILIIAIGLVFIVWSRKL